MCRQSKGGMINILHFHQAVLLDNFLFFTVFLFLDPGEDFSLADKDFFEVKKEKNFFQTRLIRVAALPYLPHKNEVVWIIRRGLQDALPDVWSAGTR